MVAVRARNTGSFDHKTKCWRLRGRGIHVTVRQLEQQYGVNFRAETPAQLEQASARYWRRFLQDIEDHHRQAQKASSPYQTRIKSLEAMIARLRAERHPDAALARLEAQLRELEAAPPHDTHYADTPVLHPDIVARAAAMEFCPSEDEADDALAFMLEATDQPRPTPKTIPSGIGHEAEVYIARHKAKGHKGWFQVRQAVSLLTGITGDIPPDQVTVHHYRQVHQKITSSPQWSKTTQANMARIVRDFLDRVAADHNLTCYGFLSNPDYILRRPKGKKVRYTLEQVKTALQHAKGEVRLALLIGLNTGGYIGDIATMTPEMIHADHLVRCRAKLRHKDNPVVGSWLLWEETRRHLTYGNKARRLQEQYSRFAQHHGLPPHKALRKTTAQMIHDQVKDAEAARLFRGEGLPGTHGTNYICDFTPEQVDRLDNALLKVGELYGVS